MGLIVRLLLLILVAATSPAFAQKTKATMTTEINTNYPDNTTQLITPSILRSTTIDQVNSYQQGVQVRTVTGASDTLLTTDYGNLVIYNNAGGVAVSIAQATGTFASFNVFVKNVGAGAVTITPATSQINGSATLVLAVNQGTWIVSDGTNYQVGPTVFAASIFGSQLASGTVTSGNIATNTVANSNLAQAGANTVKGNWTAGTANVADNTMPACTDTGGQHLNYVNGTGVTCGSTTGAPTVNAPTVQRCGSGLTCDGASHTYTPTAGMVRIKVRMCAGGGGGGAETTNAGSNGNDTSFLAGAWTVVHGSGGAVGAGAGGGTGGTGGTGGVNGTGTLVVRIPGGAGWGGQSGGIGGGTSVFGGAGAAPPQQNAGAVAGNNAATGTCSGGSGATGATGTTFGPGAGGAGEYVEFWMTAAQVGASTTYTVGLKGAGGVAGGVAGGNGADGNMIIEEFYIFLLGRDLKHDNDNAPAFINLAA